MSAIVVPLTEPRLGLRGRSAVGSASPCQGEGRGFESRRPLEGSTRPFGGVAERRGKGLQIPLHGFKSRLHLVKN